MLLCHNNYNVQEVPSEPPEESTGKDPYWGWGWGVGWWSGKVFGACVGLSDFFFFLGTHGIMYNMQPKGKFA